jgi:pSer/pThr/pTyr-binding forkhead associated (FHA) protein
MLEITVISPTGQRVRTLSVPLGDMVEVGRARGCDVQLTDPLVSRHHAVIEPADEPDAWVFRDVGSTRGSYVNGERVREVTLRPGMSVKVGSTMLRFDSLAYRISKELDRMMQDEESRGAPMQVEVIGSRGRHPARTTDADPAGETRVP